MDKKQALAIIDSMIKTESDKMPTNDILKKLRNKIVSIQNSGVQPLIKNISEVQEILKKANLELSMAEKSVKKIDPTTKLPGTLIQKGDGVTSAGMQGGSMGGDKNLTPNMAKDEQKAGGSPDMAPPMMASEDKSQMHSHIAQRLGKCMKTLTSSEKGVHQRSIIPPRTTPKMENKASSAMGDDVRSHQNFNQTKAMGNAKTSARAVLSDRKAMPKPNLPKSEEMQKA